MAFCPQCGRAVPEDDTPCPDCSGNKRSPSTITGQEATWRFDDGTTPPSSGKATASMILGFFFFLLPCAFLAVVLGHMSLGEITKSAGKLGGQSRAKAGLVLGYLGIALLPVILIGAAVSMPVLQRRRIQVNEASAITSLRTIYMAEINYKTVFGREGSYSCNLFDLGRDPVCTPNSFRACGVDSTLAGGIKDGYRFEIANCSAEGVGEAARTIKYQVIAYPMSNGQSGHRAFCSDESGVVKVDPNGDTEACLQHGQVVR